MITGANTNVRHRGRVFHVQTEDSGRANPHIISHVYHGGTIIASHKSEYGATDDDIRSMIEEQHKAMLKRLVHGEFDAEIDQRLGSTSDSPITETPPTDPPLDDSSPGEAAGSTTGSTTAGATTAPDSAGAPDPRPPAFGDSVDSKKPLDEVILEYLVEKARDRGGDKPATGRPARRKG